MMRENHHGLQGAPVALRDRKCLGWACGGGWEPDAAPTGSEQTEGGERMNCVFGIWMPEQAEEGERMPHALHLCLDGRTDQQR